MSTTTLHPVTAEAFARLDAAHAAADRLRTSATAIVLDAQIALRLEVANQYRDQMPHISIARKDTWSSGMFWFVDHGDGRGAQMFFKTHATAVQYVDHYLQLTLERVSGLPYGTFGTRTSWPDSLR